MMRVFALVERLYIMGAYSGYWRIVALAEHPGDISAILATRTSPEYYREVARPMASCLGDVVTLDSEAVSEEEDDCLSSLREAELSERECK